MDLTNTEVPVEGADAQVQPEMFSKEHVTDLVRKEKEAAFRKAQREFQAQMDSMKTGQTQSLGGMQQPDESMVDQAVERKLKALEERYNAEQEQERKSQYADYVNTQAKTYLEKMDKSGGLADDFKEMTSKFKPDKFKEIFFLANSYENTPHIIYELGKNPEKLAMIHTMMQTDPDVAKEMLDSLSRSIDHNEKAKENNKSAPPPLGQPKPSLAAGSDGPMTLAELKRSSFLRG